MLTLGECYYKIVYRKEDKSVSEGKMIEDINKLEFNLTHSMTYTLIKLNDLIKEKNKLLSSDSIDSRELSKTIKKLDKEISRLKEEFISEFRDENIDEINNYWYLRSKE